MITIGASIGAQAARRPGKSAVRLFFEPAGLLPIVRSSCRIIYYSACQNMTAEFILPSEPFPYYYFRAAPGDHTPSLNLRVRPLYRNG
ncbi:hypothetical protein M5585_17835 [Serratia ureilytica]